MMVRRRGMYRRPYTRRRLMRPGFWPRRLLWRRPLWMGGRGLFLGLVGLLILLVMVSLFIR